MMANETFVLAGIHCAGCDASIGAGLRRLDGVRDVKADHRKQTIRLGFDERSLDEDAVAKPVHRIGYAPLGVGQ